MKLILLRHAKSGWDDPTLDDHDRPLDDRGRVAATALGAWLRARGHRPARILSSTAARTRETVARLDLSDADTTFRHDLYLATASHILALARGDTPLLIVAHNPGMARAAATAVAAPPAHAAFVQYPTGAGTIVDRS
ncbi:MAG: histidine phosphatase family protein, partial [Pseudomonadota bacterium]